MNALRRFTFLTSAAAILLLGIWGCSTGTGTESRDERRETAREPAAPNPGDAAQHDAYNTGRNANPEYQANPPFEQGTSQADRDLTQRIRQAVTDDSSLSVTAQNVKIISRDGKVVLMGPVQSAEERQRIETLATQAAGAGNVTNQLEVRTQ